MKQSFLIGVFAIVVASAALGFWYFQNSNNSAMVKDSSTTIAMDKNSSSPEADSQQFDPAVGAEETKMMNSGAGGGVYVPYTPDSLASYNSSRRVLFFFANWCPTCKPADAEFSQKSSELPKDVVVIRVNYNDSDTDQAEKDLAKKYGVAYQHTYVQIDSAGNELTKWNGGGLEKLLNSIR